MAKVHFPGQGLTVATLPPSVLRCSARVLQRSAPANFGNLDLPGSKPP
jgi:hypothetical protein